eukprot:1697648-Amphidinium_carterae.1
MKRRALLIWRTFGYMFAGLWGGAHQNWLCIVRPPVPYLDFAAEFRDAICSGRKRATARCPGPKVAVSLTEVKGSKLAH